MSRGQQADADVISSVLGGDTEAFALLIEKYKENVFKIVSRHIPNDDKEEIANDIFFKAFKSLKTFKSDAPFMNWLSVISVRTCKDYWRLRYATNEDPISSFGEDMETFLLENPAEDDTPEEELINSETKTLLYNAIEQLKPSERMIINMMYAEEKSVAETATLMEMTESNVKIIAFRARKKLASILNNFMGGANETSI